MFSFEQMTYEAEQLFDDNEIRDFLNNFFCERNFNQYLIDGRANKDERLAIENMFNDDESLLVRAKMVSEECPLCVEAFYVNYRLSEDVEVFWICEDAYEKYLIYDSLSAYEQDCFKTIMNYYVDLLLHIHNLTRAESILKVLLDLEKDYSIINVSKLAYVYCLLERDEPFYSLYLDRGFRNIPPYLLLIVVLLKHNEDNKAKEVLSELLEKYPYADYIDHIWDLEDNPDDDAVEFHGAVETCFEEICSVPYFFSWCSSNKSLPLRS